MTDPCEAARCDARGLKYRACRGCNVEHCNEHREATKCKCPPTSNKRASSGAASVTTPAATSTVFLLTSEEGKLPVQAAAAAETKQPQPQKKASTTIREAALARYRLGDLPDSTVRAATNEAATLLFAAAREHGKLYADTTAEKLPAVQRVHVESSFWDLLVIDLRERGISLVAKHVDTLVKPAVNGICCWRRSKPAIHKPVTHFLLGVYLNSTHSCAEALIAAAQAAATVHVSALVESVRTQMTMDGKARLTVDLDEDQHPDIVRWEEVDTALCLEGMQLRERRGTVRSYRVA